jgi:lipopolysaccharide/colanic/teichoic acid biosynthesis glycosyltransferase
MNEQDRVFKRTFDFWAALIILMLVWPIIVVCAVIARIDTGASGLFWQERIGLEGRAFKVVKIRTMKSVPGTTITAAHDARITPWGRRFRNWKLDELPQLWNVLKGEMSFVGPRPDVPGYLDRLEGEDRRLLTLRPGITGPATLKYRDEEVLLSQVDDPEAYNNDVIWPDKVRLNLKYLDEWSFWSDLKYIWKTLRRD